MNLQSNCDFVLDFWAGRHPSKIAIYTENRSITYGELAERSVQIAEILQRKGLVGPNRVLLFMPNCVEYCIVFFALIRLQVDIVPVNAFCKENEIVQIVHMMRPKAALVIDTDRSALLHSIEKNLSVMDVSLENMDFWERCENSDSLSLCPKKERSPSVFFSTSGSTGKMKFVSNTYQNEILNAKLYLTRLRVTQVDILLSGLPAAHKFGMAAMLGNLIAGSTLILQSRFDAKKAVSLIEKKSVTVQYGVPTMYRKEMEAYRECRIRCDISSLRAGIIAGASGSSDVFRWFEDVAGCRLLNCYGTSEIGGLTMVAFDDTRQVRYHTCGQAFRNAVVEIIDQNGRTLPLEKTGEIICTVPWRMNEYVGEPEMTARAFDSHGRFLTGDVGKLDEAGNLVICGRKKDLIIRGGYNIYPAEVELALLKHPDILEACAMGYQDDCLGERICAFVKTVEGVSFTQEDIRRQIRPFIAKYKLPDRVVFMNEIPKLANGKIDHTALAMILKKQPKN